MHFFTCRTSVQAVEIIDVRSVTCLFWTLTEINALSRCSLPKGIGPRLLQGDGVVIVEVRVNLYGSPRFQMWLVYYTAERKWFKCSTLHPLSDFHFFFFCFLPDCHGAESLRRVKVLGLCVTAFSIHRLLCGCKVAADSPLVQNCQSLQRGTTRLCLHQGAACCTFLFCSLRTSKVKTLFNQNSVTQN